jgi:hypothetical protein
MGRPAKLRTLDNLWKKSRFSGWGEQNLFDQKTKFSGNISPPVINIAGVKSLNYRKVELTAVNATMWLFFSPIQRGA